MVAGAGVAEVVPRLDVSEVVETERVQGGGGQDSRRTRPADGRGLAAQEFMVKSSEVDVVTGVDAWLEVSVSEVNGPELKLDESSSDVSSLLPTTQQRSLQISRQMISQQMC